MRYAMLCLIALCVLGGSFLGNAKSQPGQFSDPLADDVKALKAEVKAQGDRLAALEAAAANLPFRNSDPLQQVAGRTPAALPTTFPVQAVPTVTALYGGRYSVCDGNGCRVVTDPGGLFRPASVTTYTSSPVSCPCANCPAGGGCTSGQCGVSGCGSGGYVVTQRAVGLFGRRR